jgi:hypothetical protein
MSLTRLSDDERLQMTNWIEWKRSMIPILRMKGLWGYVDGSVKPPSRSHLSRIPDTTATPATPTPSAQVTTSSSNPFVSAQPQAATQSTGGLLGLTKSDKKPLPYPPTSSTSEEEWTRLDAAASTHITLNIKNRTILSKFRSGMSAAEIWASLCTRFERTNGFIALQARNKLNGCKYMDGRDLQSHLDTMSALWQDALAVGVEIGDDEFCHILRSSLPPSWAILVATLISVNNPILLESSLLAYADLQGRSSKPTPSSSPAALLSSTATTATTAQCTNCGKDNHTFDRCYRKGGGSEHSAPHWWRERQRRPLQGPPRAKIATAENVHSPSSPDSPRSAPHNITAFTTTHDHNPFRRHMSSTSTNPFRRHPFPQTDPVSQSTSGHVTSDYHLFVASVGNGPETASQRVMTYADSGASHHYFVDRSDFSTYMEITPIAGQ